MIYLCTQDTIAPDECVSCGDWRPPGEWLQPDGPAGFRFCSQDCIADYQQAAEDTRRAAHLNTRDMLCACPEVCAPRGLPSDADRAEYAAFVLALPEEDRRHG